MLVKNLQTVIAYRDQELKIDLGKSFDGILSASMARETDVIINTREFEIVDNRYLVLSRDKTQDEDMDEEIKNPVIGRWYFDVRQELPDSNQLIYTGTIFFKGNITQ